MAGLAVYVLVTDTANSEFSGMGMILMTFPWSLAWVFIENALGIIGWYGRLGNTPALYGACASLALLPAAIPNTVLLYLFGRILERKPGAKAASK